MGFQKRRQKHSRQATVALVCSELFKRNIGVMPDPKQASHLMCINTNLKRVGVRIVKANNSTDTWTLTHEAIKGYRADDLFFVFVGFRNSLRPKLYVVPSKTVLSHTDKNALEWISSPRRDKKPRKNIGTRKFILTADEKKKYLNRWDLLGLD